MLRRFGLVVAFLFMAACGAGEAGNGGGDNGGIGVGNGSNGNGQPGDHAGNFIGTWAGTATVSITDPRGGQPQSQNVTYSTQITRGANANQVQFNGTCNVLGTADNDTHVTVTPKNCPATPDQSGCTLAIQITSGSFVRNGSTATLHNSGHLVATGCSAAGTYGYSVVADNLAHQQ